MPPEAEAMGSKRQGARVFQVMNSGTTFQPVLRHNFGEGDRGSKKTRLRREQQNNTPFGVLATTEMGSKGSMNRIRYFFHCEIHFGQGNTSLQKDRGKCSFFIGDSKMNVALSDPAFLASLRRHATLSFA
jgi:hypothetical protein